MRTKQPCPFCGATGYQMIEVAPDADAPAGYRATEWEECRSCLAQGRCPACGDWPLKRTAGDGAERSCRRCNWDEEI
jgi:hypothetical protein